MSRMPTTVDGSESCVVGEVINYQFIATFIYEPKMPATLCSPHARYCVLAFRWLLSIHLICKRTNLKVIEQYFKICSLSFALLAL